MANLKEIRGRIKSIDNTAKITHAMELVAAAKMKKAQDQAVGGKPYSRLVNDIIRRMANNIDPKLHPLLASKKGDRSLIIIFSTDRGLAGALNTNLMREVEKAIGNLNFLSIGKKARNFITKAGKNLMADFELPDRPDLDSVRPISKLMIDGFLADEFDQVHVLYTEFVSTIKQKAVLRQLLPIIDKEILKELAEEAERGALSEPKFEPNADIVLETILPQYILMELYQILLEAKASEHSARMVAMKNATDNAKSLAEDLTLEYNGVRQSSITSEILDISTAQVVIE